MYKANIQVIGKQKQINSNLPRKEVYRMDAYLTHYIDNNIIKQYCDYTPEGYSLCISELSEHDRCTLADLLYTHDDVAREMIDDFIQNLIDARLPFVSAHENYNRGLKPKHDTQTGEVSWSR